MYLPARSLPLWKERTSWLPLQGSRARRMLSSVSVGSVVSRCGWARRAAARVTGACRGSARVRACRDGPSGVADSRSRLVVRPVRRVTSRNSQPSPIGAISSEPQQLPLLAGRPSSLQRLCAHDAYVRPTDRIDVDRNAGSTVALPRVRPLAARASRMRVVERPPSLRRRRGSRGARPASPRCEAASRRLLSGLRAAEGGGRGLTGNTGRTRFRSPAHPSLAFCLSTPSLVRSSLSATDQHR